MPSSIWGYMHRFLLNVLPLFLIFSVYKPWVLAMDDIVNQERHRTESKVSQTLGANIACLIIAYTGLLLRLLSRKISRAHIGIDDWLTILALVSGLELQKHG